MLKLSKSRLTHAKLLMEEEEEEEGSVQIRLLAQAISLALMDGKEGGRGGGGERIGKGREGNS